MTTRKMLYSNIIVVLPMILTIVSCDNPQKISSYGSTIDDSIEHGIINTVLEHDSLKGFKPSVDYLGQKVFVSNYFGNEYDSNLYFINTNIAEDVYSNFDSIVLSKYSQRQVTDLRVNTRMFGDMIFLNKKLLDSLYNSGYFFGYYSFTKPVLSSDNTFAIVELIKHGHSGNRTFYMLEKKNNVWSIVSRKRLSVT